MNNLGNVYKGLVKNGKYDYIQANSENSSKELELKFGFLALAWIDKMRKKLSNNMKQRWDCEWHLWETKNKLEHLRVIFIQSKVRMENTEAMWDAISHSSLKDLNFI